MHSHASEIDSEKPRVKALADRQKVYAGNDHPIAESTINLKFRFLFVNSGKITL